MIFSNQAGLTDDNKIKEFDQFIHSLCKEFDFGLTIYASIRYDIYRKPCNGMWLHYLSTNSLGSSYESFYVGDAAGRKGDHAYSDMYWLNNNAI